MKSLILSVLTALASGAAITPLVERQGVDGFPYNVDNFFYKHTPQTSKVLLSFDVANPTAGLARTHCTVTQDCANGGKLCAIPRSQCANPDVFFQIDDIGASGQYSKWLLSIQYCQGDDGQIGLNYQFEQANDLLIEVPEGSGKTWEAIIPPNRAFTSTGNQVPEISFCRA